MANVPLCPRFVHRAQAEGVIYFMEAALVPIDERDRTYDVAVVGAGPAGLSTAVYAASEGTRNQNKTASPPAQKPLEKRVFRGRGLAPAYA
jgi:hypothetical protein